MPRPRCEQRASPGMRFFGPCAAPLASTCPSCGAANPPKHKFCGQWGARLQTTPTARSVAPGSYTLKHLAEKSLTSKTALEGERSQATVLFAGLRARWSPRLTVSPAARRVPVSGCSGE